MPIQLLLDWSKALVAIVCSLLLAISFIMCTVKSVPINSNSSDLAANHSYSSLTRNAIESEIQPISTTTTTNAMPFDSFDLNVMKNDTHIIKMRPNATARMKKMAASPLNKNISATMMANNISLNESNELKLAAAHENGGQDNFNRLTSFAKVLTNATFAGQAAINPYTSSTLNQQNAIQRITTTNNTAHTKLASKKFPHSTKSPIMQTTHQSTTTITPKATIQSVFLDYATNFNGTKSKHIDSIIHNDSLRHATENRQDINTTTRLMTMMDDAILSRTERSVQIASNKRKILRNDSSNADRIERSANFSLTKATKRIQLLIKGRFLQMLPDGTVNGTQEDQSEYTVLQRTTVDVGQIRLIGIATCLYLCMDSCGNLYSSREFTNDCIFNERLENNYNYYTSTHHSSPLRTYYVALNRLGVPRKTHLPANKPLAKLSTYVKAFTLTVPEPRSEAIIGKRFGLNHVKHGIKHLCESGKQLMELTAKQLVYPECKSGKSGSSSSSGSVSSSLSKQQPNHHHHHMRHANQNHRRNGAPAALTDSRSNKKSAGAAATDAIIKSGNCNTEPCHKRRKSNNSGNRSGGNHNNHNNNHSHNRKNVKKSNPKAAKKSNKKLALVTPSKTTMKTTTTTTTTTESAILYGPTNVPDNYEDDFDYLSGSVPIASNGQIGLTSDEDYYESET